MLSQFCSTDSAAARIIPPKDEPSKNVVVAAAYMSYMTVRRHRPRPKLEN